LALKVKHKLTSEAISDIGRLVNVACNAEKVFASKYYFYKHFAPYISYDYEIHQICKECHSYIGVIINDSTHCPNILCNHLQTKTLQHDTFFMYLPLERQLLSLVENIAIKEFKQNSQNSEHIENDMQDIYDGEL